MKINSLRDLQQLAKLCKKAGIVEIEIDGIKLKLNGLEAKPTKVRSSVQSLPDYSSDIPQANYEIPTKVENIDTDELTPEELLMYSVAGQQ